MKQEQGESVAESAGELQQQGGAMAAMDVQCTLQRVLSMQHH